MLDVGASDPKCDFCGRSFGAYHVWIGKQKACSECADERYDVLAREVAAVRERCERLEDEVQSLRRKLWHVSGVLRKM